MAEKLKEGCWFHFHECNSLVCALKLLLHLTKVKIKSSNCSGKLTWHYFQAKIMVPGLNRFRKSAKELPSSQSGWMSLEDFFIASFLFVDGVCGPGSRSGIADTFSCCTVVPLKVEQHYFYYFGNPGFSGEMSGPKFVIELISDLWSQRCESRRNKSGFLTFTKPNMFLMTLHGVKWTKYCEKNIE